MDPTSRQVDHDGFYKVVESSQEPRREPIPEDPIDRAILVLVPQVARHGDRIHQVEEDCDSLRRDIKVLASRVRDLEEGRDIDKTGILHAYNYLEETHSVSRL